MLRPVLRDADDLLREQAIAYVNAVADASGGVVRRDQLEAFHFDSVRVPLIATQQGIWKPRQLEAALSFLTVWTRPGRRPPYEDEIGEDGYPRYKWRGTDPRHRDNVALRRAMELAKPLIWYIGQAPGVFTPLAPVWLAAEEPAQQQFVVSFDQWMREGWRRDLGSATRFDPARRYAQVLVRQRLHQRPFRDRVLLAYRMQCALCRLRHPPLLDAAHIKEDSAGGEPIVTNGLAMCAIHHRAFDANVLTVTREYRIEVSPKVLAEHDGPTLQHALQGLHGERIELPSHRADHPDRELLEERHERFLASASA
jgi:putative restriction endonuclease